jgi:broad specificity phosphatase PhoE
MIQIVAVRHGQSLGNAAHRAAKQGDHTLFTEAFSLTHSSQWPLTELGRAQAQTAGARLRDEYPDGFTAAYVSPYVRARETAHFLAIPGLQWDTSFALRERSWGDIDYLPGRFTGEMKRQKAIRASAPFFWTPPGGESLAQVVDRLTPLLDSLLRAGSGRYLFVCHGEVMTAIRAMLDARFRERMVTGSWTEDDDIVIRNCEYHEYAICQDGTRVRRVCGDPSLAHDAATGAWCSETTMRLTGADLAPRSPAQV